MAFDLLVEEGDIAPCDQGIDRQIKLICNLKSIDSDRTGGPQKDQTIPRKRTSIMIEANR